MKYIPLFALVLLIACNQQSSNTSKLQSQIDSLQSKLANAYKPGFGEFMSSIQVHHNKLWFAGQSQNWKLADFEIHEIWESIEDIEKYQTEREESQKIGMIKPALDSVISAIEQKNGATFNSSFILLTNTCNNCHKATNFEFNQVKIPDNPPFSNQIFKNP
ncbi:MAG: hypothetical protein ICV66_00680 [Chitinophagaceae bacterium]|nr:hypothetical protein [Chitinophagaceae bacterium]